MKELSKNKCEACRIGEPEIKESEISELLTEIPDWKILTRENHRFLERVFKFKNFVEALEFANKVGAAAEEENHHPLIVIEWGKVTIQWWTNSIKGLHKNDFIMSSKTDDLYQF